MAPFPHSQVGVEHIDCTMDRVEHLKQTISPLAKRARTHIKAENEPNKQQNEPTSDLAVSDHTLSPFDAALRAPDRHMDCHMRKFGASIHVITFVRFAKPACAMPEACMALHARGAPKLGRTFVRSRHISPIPSATFLSWAAIKNVALQGSGTPQGKHMRSSRSSAGNGRGCA